MASSSSPDGDSWRAHYSPAPGMRTPFSSDYEAPEEPESEEVIRSYSPSSFTAGGKKSTDTGITVSSNLKTGSPLPTPGGLGGDVWLAVWCTRPRAVDWILYIESKAS